MVLAVKSRVAAIPGAWKWTRICAAASPGTKAAAIQPRTLEYLDRVGLAGTLIDDGLRGGGFAVRSTARFPGFRVKLGYKVFFALFELAGDDAPIACKLVERFATALASRPLSRARSIAATC